MANIEATDTKMLHNHETSLLRPQPKHKANDINKQSQPLLANLADNKHNYNFKDLVRDIGADEEAKYSSLHIDPTRGFVKKIDQKNLIENSDKIFQEPHSPPCSE